MNNWINHTSKTFKYVLYNPSWKEILELQRILGNGVTELGMIFVSGPINNIQDFSKIKSKNICIWYGFNKRNSNLFLKHVDNQFGKVKEEFRFLLF